MSDLGGSSVAVAVKVKVNQGKLHGYQHACLAGKRGPLSEQH